MRSMKISTALLAVPVCVLALACETDTATEESLVAPPGPSFGHLGAVTMCIVSAGVVQKVKGHTIAVTGTSGIDHINCDDASLKVQVSAGKGSDNVLGSDFDDHISGGKGCDRVGGGDGNDVVDGGPGNDSEIGPGGCLVSAGSGLGAGSGIVFGGSGDDLLKGGVGNDRLNGGDGGEDAGDVCEGGKGGDSYGLCEVCGDPDQAGIPPCP